MSYAYRRRGQCGGRRAAAAVLAGLLLAAAAHAHHHPAGRHAGPPSTAAGAQGPAAANVALARRLAAADGWGQGPQWRCLDALWTRESAGTWSPTVWNYQGSGAYGIPQALPADKMASAGPDWRTNPATQIRWGLGYITTT